MPREILWSDVEEIGIQLQEKYPEIDPLTVRFTDLAGGAESIPAIEGGSLDISHAPYVSLLQARDQGFDFVALVTNNAAPSKPPRRKPAWW